MALSSGRLVTGMIGPSAGKGAPDCSKAKLTVQLHPRESKSQSRMRTEMGEMGKYSRGCSWTVSFAFEQSGAPFPALGPIIPVTKRPELSAILNCASYDPNGFGPPF